MVTTEEEVELDLSQRLRDLRRAIYKGRWCILTTTCLVPLVTIAVLSFVPNRYKSEATLLVVQQQVPQRYVVPNSTTDITSELQAMKQDLLSRSRLQDIIAEFGLYREEATRLAPEQMVKKMLQDIDIRPLESAPTRKDFDGFKISFVAENPTTAQQVTSKLTSIFIQENLRTREQQAKNTTEFLDKQLEVARTNLVEQEERLKDFKMRYLGELPEQQQGNLGILTSIQTQLQNTMAAMSRAQEQRVYLESLLSGYQARNLASATGSGLFGPTQQTGRPVGPLEAAYHDVSRLETAFSSLSSRYTARHPDVIRLKGELASAKSRLERLQTSVGNSQTLVNEAKVSDGGEAKVSESIVIADEPAVAQLKSQLEANRMEMSNLGKDEAKLKDSLVEYEKRLNLIPMREQQLTGILREYDLQKQNYSDLLSKELQSKLATNLERQQGGQQFRLIDPPSFPVIPSSPKRDTINVAAVAGGLVMGLALSVLMDFRNRFFYNERQLRKHFAVPLVVGIPLLSTPTENRSRVWRHSIELVAGCIVTLIVCLVEVYAHKHP